MSKPETDAPMPESEAALPQREDNQALTVVGMGGSAGSITALQTFFENVRPDTISAYVVVLHLSADYESHLPEVLARSSVLPVQQVTQTVRIEAGHVYVIPPGKHLHMQDGSLELRDLDPTPGRRVAIDTFFRALANAHGPQSAAVVFSGTGADGTLGIRQIKELGGLVVAQSPSEAEYDAMPRSAIATGLVDYVLPVNAMPAQIAAYWETSRVMRIPADAAPSPDQREEGDEQESALHDILTHVRAQTGHDFTFYKRATVLRRIGRRMQVNGVETLPRYRDYLRLHPAEVGGLIGDLLISVTQFFRDPKAWALLNRDVLPPIFAGKTGSEAEVRAWVCGCATGEEAYTLAILLLEQAERMPQPPRVQVFATDMDAPAISRARAGIYPDTIAADVSEERLRRWFYRQDGAYQVRKEVREVVLFAHHDVLRDTPFSRLDLVTCRNLLIYLNREAQERMFRTFHFALRPDSSLMLGPSESAEGVDGLFLATNKNQRLFVRRSVPRSAVPPLPAPLFLPDFSAVREAARGLTGGATEGTTEGATERSLSPNASPVSSAFVGSAVSAVPSLLYPSRADAGSGSSISRDLLPRYGPPVVVVNEEYAIVHLSGSVSDFLRLPEGEPTLNLLELVHPNLRPELRGAFFGASQEGVEQIRVVRGVDHEDGENRTSSLKKTIRLSVRPVPASLISPLADTPGFFIVQFEALSPAVLTALRPLLSEMPLLDASVTLEDAPANAAKASADLTRGLEQENSALQRNLRVSSEQYDAVTEELKASNEEMQAVNEEMRSVVEELETGKEELQSVNEELSTVNFELKARVDELTGSNSDLSNFLGATDIATLFLDRVLNVKRFTSAALALFNLIPTDVGRPLAHITNRLDYPTLEEDATAVLGRLIPIEREITSADGQRHFMGRLLPYRSLDDRIEGVVVTFTDISVRKRAEETMRQSEERLQAAIDIETVGVIFFNNAIEITDCNDAFVRMSGWTRGEIKASRFSWELFTPGEFVEPSRRALEELRTKGISTPYEKEYIRKDGSRFWALFSGKRISETELVEFVTDISEQKQAQEALRASEAAFRTISDAAPALVWVCDASGKNVYFNERWFDFTGQTESEAQGSGWTTAMHPDDAAKILPYWERCQQTGELYEGEVRYRRNDGEYRWHHFRALPRRSESGTIEAWYGVSIDIHAAKIAEEPLRESQERLRLALDAAQLGTFTYYAAEDRTEPDARMLALFGVFEGEEFSLPAAIVRMIYPDDSERYVQAVAHAIDPNGSGALNEEIRVAHPDGSLHWVAVTGQTQFTGEPPLATQISGVAADITERKQGLENLRESEERFRLLVDGARDYAMLLLDPDGRITFWSVGAQRVFGWTEAEVLGQPAEMLFTPEDREQNLAKREREASFAEGRAPDRRWHLRRDGSRFWADGVMMRLDDASGNLRGYAKIARDATEQRNAEALTQSALEAVALANDQLEQRVQERTQELSDMSDMRQELLRQVVSAQEEERGRISRDLHDDTGQVVTALLLGLENLKSAPPVAADSHLQERLAYLQSLAGEVAQKSHRLSFTLRPTGLDDLGLMEMLRNYTEEWSQWSGLPVMVESIGFDPESGERLPPEVETTIYRVAQEALTNILRYATRDSDTGTAATRVDILVQRRRSDPEGMNVLTVIEDDGPGFDVESVLNRPPGKRRLGIFGMQERARLAGGTLDIESTLGEGTTVYLHIPLPPK